MAKYGGGCIRQMGRDKWRLEIEFGRDPVTGDRNRISKVVNGTKADAKRELEKIRRNHEDGLVVDAETMTFADHAEQWREACEIAGGLSPKTLQENEWIVRTLCDYIGDVRLKDITPRVVEALYAKMGGERGWSGTTLNKFHVKLKQIMRRAVDMDLILRNPCDRVQAPKKNDVERRALTASEAARLMRALDEAETEERAAIEAKEQRRAEGKADKGRTAIRGVHNLANMTAVRIGLATGMRLGEVLALTWESVDLLDAKAKVRATISPNGELRKPKTKSARRTLALDGETCAHLVRWKAEQSRALEKIGVCQTAATPVVCTDVGTHCNVGNFEAWWGRWRKAHGFEELKFHELRHTQATLLLANGIDVKTVQARLGHADASLTLNTYAHAIPCNDEAAAGLIGAITAGEGACRVYEIKGA